MNDYDWNNEKDNIDTGEAPSQETQKLQPEQESQQETERVSEESTEQPESICQDPEKTGDQAPENIYSDSAKGEGVPQEESPVDRQEVSQQQDNFRQESNAPQYDRPPYDQPSGEYHPYGQPPYQQPYQYGYGQQPYTPPAPNSSPYPPQPPYNQRPHQGGYGYGQPTYWQSPPYNGYPPRNYPPYGQQPYRPPYQGGYGYGQPQQPRQHQYAPPYGQAPYQPRQEQPGEPFEKKKMSVGLKLFLWILGGIAAIFVLAFCAFGVYSALNSASGSSMGGQQLPGGAPGSGDSSSSSQPEEDKAQPAPDGEVTDPDSPGIIIEEQPGGDEMSAQHVYAKVSPSIVGVIATTEKGQSSGSGIIAREDGYIITNSHVINDSKTNKTLQVILHDGTTYDAVVVGFDKTTDLAVVKINATGLTAAEFGNSDTLSVGQYVVAIGNPGGMNYAGSMTNGMISGLDRTVGYSDAGNMTYIQHNAAISPGASGGGLVNMYGQVVGINSSKLVASGYEGLGFAIPITKAKTILDDLITNGYVTGRARLGIGANDISAMQAQMYGLPQGVLIASIDNESAFNGTGVQVGDIIIKADGSDIATMEQLYQALGLRHPGDTMTLTIYRARDGVTSEQTFEVAVTLLEDQGETQSTIILPNGSSVDQ